jgi:hypothetical protein
MVATSFAKRMQFPYNDPTFSLEMPGKGTFSDDEDGTVQCDPNDDSGYVVSILNLKDVHTQSELKAALPKLVKAMAQGAKIKNLEVGDVTTGKNGNGISFTGQRGDGKTDGMDFVVMVHAFEAKKGKFFAICSAGTQEADANHEKHYDAITASIEAVD